MCWLELLLHGRELRLDSVTKYEIAELDLERLRKPSLIRHYHVQTQFLHFELALKPVGGRLFLHVLGLNYSPDLLEILRVLIRSMSRLSFMACSGPDHYIL